MYTIIKTKEQEKLELIRNSMKCFAGHLWIGKDSSNHIWPFTSCPECNQLSFCRKLKHLVEEEVNR